MLLQLIVNDFRCVWQTCEIFRVCTCISNYISRMIHVDRWISLNLTDFICSELSAGFVHRFRPDLQGKSWNQTWDMNFFSQKEFWYIQEVRLDKQNSNEKEAAKNLPHPLFAAEIVMWNLNWGALPGEFFFPWKSWHKWRHVVRDDCSVPFSCGANRWHSLISAARSKMLYQVAETLHLNFT